MVRKKYELILLIILIIVLVVPRVVDLVKFTAADEPFWLAVGANYYYALTHRDFENTVYEYHPAVTTMWIVTGAMLIYFPEFRGMMNGYFVQEKSTFDSFLVQHGKNPLDLLWWSRLLQLLLNVGLFMVAYLLIGYMFDRQTALATLLFTSFSPYLFGQSRLLNHESMLGLFSLISILAVTAYLYNRQKLMLLLLSAAAAAYANLTKSSSIVLLPVVGLIVCFWAANLWKTRKWAVIPSALGIFLSWLGMIALVYFISWPGMWVAPGKMLYEVYGNAFSYAFQGARLSVTQQLTPSNFNLDLALPGITNFLISIAWRTTPVTWLGFLFAILSLFYRNEELITPRQKYIVLFLVLEAVACIAMFAIARGRNSPHYVLAAYYGFEFAAALGWVFILRWLVWKYPWNNARIYQAGVFTVILALQASGLTRTYPYYYTYLNPVMAAAYPPPVFLYGERMEEAAAYLAAKPGAGDLTALVYFGRTFSYHFPGRTIVFKPVMFENKNLLIEYLQEADYLVMYAGLHDRLPLLKELTPEKIIELDGRPYVEIYRVSDIPVGFFTKN